MKKILLGTTTLFGAAALFAGAALADSPKVTVGGYENFEMGYTDDELNGYNGTVPDTHKNAQDEQHTAFRSDTQVDFKIDGKSDSGLGYGGEIDLLADTSASVQSQGVNASKTFIYADGLWGRVELGSNVGADGTMKVDAGTIARATGGIDGDWSYFANAATQFVAEAALPLAYGLTPAHSIIGTVPTTGAFDGQLVTDNYLGNHSEENSDKITYYTPRYAGFQVGLSFVPDQTTRGQGASNTGLGASIQPGPDGAYIAGESHDIFTGGLNYDNKFGDVGLALAATGEWGEANTTGYDNLEAWEGGGKLSYMGWSLAGSYGSWGKSNQLKSDGPEDSHFWDAGLAYEYGPFGVSLTYLDSTYGCGTTYTAGVSACPTGDLGDNKFNSYSLGADYKLAPGLTPYVELTAYDEKAAPSAAALGLDDKGYVGIVGTQLNF